LSKPRDLSKLFSTSTSIATDVELISTVNSASAYALSEANDYTDNELSSIDLTSTINTASAAAFASASAYTDSAIASFEALPSQDGNAGKYLSTSGSVTSWEELDLNAAINTASAAAYASASAYTDSQISNIDLSATIQTASAAAVNFLVDSAPGTLDTLNELSEALNDDPNFYSTIQAVYLTQSSASATYATKAEAQNSLDRWTKTYSASATTISGLDDTANTLLYTQNFENLYINGILQDPSNYTATSGSTIILNQAVVTNDVVEVISINPFNVANTYTQTQSDNKFLNLVSASNSYLTQASASSTYLTQSNASSLYLTQSNGSTIYATKESPTFTGTVNFSSSSVVGIDALPDQTGNDGKYLTTNGIIASWSEITTDPTPTVFLLGGM
jgi:hypothetical protein